MLPTYISTLAENLRPLDLGVHVRRDIWLSYRRGIGKAHRLSAVRDWLRACFAAERYPWFAADFVHPQAFGGISHRLAKIVVADPASIPLDSFPIQTD